MKIDRSRNRKARIEMIPLIDVIFLLLVTFILFSMTMTAHRGLSLDLPDASTAAVEREPLVVVSVAADGRLFLDGEPLEEGALKQRIAELRRAEPNHRVLVSGDRNASYERIILVMDTLRSAGVPGVILETAGEGAGSSGEVP
ncbi:MAG: hypothetical protein AVO39_09790 [delta proteobacterium MLS_D]|jgi:biopolymer transport protein ExbD|nr:MAG: hypothetical protein AVO39_09790 [delta proteobacterium MLS_D]